MILAIGLLALPLLWFALPHFLRYRAVGRLAALCASRRVIVLSYDDGPGDALTPMLLELLARHDSRATFYMIGSAAEARLATFGSVRAAGHEIGNHTQDHCNAWKVWPWRAAADQRAGTTTLVRLGAALRTFRPPYGKTTPVTWLVARRAKEVMAFWTIDSRDSWKVPRSIAKVIAMIQAQGGGVVLMHDCDRPPRARIGHDHGAHVLALTAAILDLARRQDFAILRFCDLQDISSLPPPGGRLP